MILHMKMRISEACCSFFFIPTANFATKYGIIFMNEYRIRFFFFSSPFKGMNQNLEWRPDGKKLPIDLRIFDVITEIQTG